MIGLLTGQPHITPHTFLLVCNGVGYEVHVATAVHAQATGAALLTLFIYTHVREDQLELYGFLTEEEKQLFLLMLAVSGVGPKTALAIADYGAEKISLAIQNADVGFFTRIPRVGKKMAQKIIIELKSKLGGIKELQLGSLDPRVQTIVDAVVTLGYEEEAAIQAVKDITFENKSESELIKELLKKL